MGRGARIFLMSALICACVFSLIAFAVISGVNDSVKREEHSVRNGPETPYGVEGSSFNLLFVLTQESGLPQACVLLRADRERAEYTFTPICVDTVVNKKSLKSTYLSSGIDGMVKEVHSLTGIAVDFHAIVTAENTAEWIGEIGGVRITLDSDLSFGSLHLEAGTRVLTREDASALLSLNSDAYIPERVLSELLRSVCERLSKNDGLECYASFCTLASTTLTYDAFAVRYSLISAYPQLKSSTLEIVGEYKGNSADRYFIPDTQATLDRFSDYRKYYN